MDGQSPLQLESENLLFEHEGLLLICDKIRIAMIAAYKADPDEIFAGNYQAISGVYTPLALRWKSQLLGQTLANAGSGRAGIEKAGGAQR